MEQALALVSQFVETGDRLHSIFAVNPEKIFPLTKDPFLSKVFKDTDLLIPDGIGVVMAAKILHAVKLSQLTGVELMENICKLSARKGYRVFILGAKEEVNETAVGPSAKTLS